MTALLCLQSSTAVAQHPKEKHTVVSRLKWKKKNVLSNINYNNPLFISRTKRGGIDRTSRSVQLFFFYVHLSLVLLGCCCTRAATIVAGLPPFFFFYSFLDRESIILRVALLSARLYPSSERLHRDAIDHISCLLLFHLISVLLLLRPIWWGFLLHARAVDGACNGIKSAPLIMPHPPYPFSCSHRSPCASIRLECFRWKINKSGLVLFFCFFKYRETCRVCKRRGGKIW